MDLEAFKAENAAEEAATEVETPTPPQAVEEETPEVVEDEAVEVETEEPEEAAEPTEEEPEETETEAWMQGDDQPSDAEIPNSAWKAST